MFIGIYLEGKILILEQIYAYKTQKYIFFIGLLSVHQIFTVTSILSLEKLMGEREG